MVNSIQLKHNQNDNSDSSYCRSQDSMSIQSQKIKKNQRNTKRRRRRARQAQDSERQPYNFSSGRPGRPEQQEEKLNSNLQTILSEQWFGNHLATNLLIFFCLQGNMIFKITTGKPAAANASLAKNQLDSELQKKVKKFKKQFKKQLKAKHRAILEYLGYSKDTTYLLLQTNQYESENLDIPPEVSFSTRQGLLGIRKFISPQFFSTYRLIIKEYYSQQYVIEDQKIYTIIDKLKEEQYKHAMIFDIQLIKELMKVDNEVMQRMDQSPIFAEEHFRETSTIIVPSFHSRAFMDQKDAIFDSSSWIKGFIEQFFQILSAYY